jgi:hypothetical protein
MSARSFPIEIEITSVERGAFRFADDDPSTWPILRDPEQIMPFMYALLIAARVGMVRHRGIDYALTWDAGVVP